MFDSATSVELAGRLRAVFASKGLTRQRRDLLTSPFEIDFVHFTEQQVSFVGRHEPSLEAAKERESELVFGVLQDLAHRRL